MNNSIHLVGNVGNDPELTKFESGNKKAKFSLAVKDFGGGDEEAKTMWIDVEAWGKNADRVMEVVKKGREVAVMGRLSLSNYTKTVRGEEVTMTKAIVKLIGFHACGRKKPDAKVEVADQPTSNEEAA